MYPIRISTNTSSRPVAETPKLSESVFDTRTLLQSILKDGLPILESALAHKAAGRPGGTTAAAGGAAAGSSAPQNSQIKTCQRMVGVLLADAHRAFVACFHAFYPTGYLKWACLCNLLATMKNSTSGGQGQGGVNCDR